MIDKLIEKIKSTNNPSVVGLDTSFDYLPKEMQDSTATFEDIGAKLFEFNKNIIDNIYDIVPAVKVQVAYYEMYGVGGMKAFCDTLAYAKSRGMITIADIKRNDIGSTAAAYSKAYLGGANFKGQDVCPFDSHFVTLNGYLGSDGILPFTKDCKNNGKGAFILVKTSNPSSGELQNLKLESGKMVCEQMADMVQEWGQETIGKYGYSSIGAVVGATHPAEAKMLREKYKSMFFLVPGYGAQGGGAADVAASFDENGIGGIVNSSRGILCAYKSEKYAGMSYFEGARQASMDMQKDLTTHIRMR